MDNINIDENNNVPVSKYAKISLVVAFIPVLGILLFNIFALLSLYEFGYKGRTGAKYLIRGFFVFIIVNLLYYSSPDTWPYVATNKTRYTRESYTKITEYEGYEYRDIWGKTHELGTEVIFDKDGTHKGKIFDGKRTGKWTLRYRNKNMVKVDL